MEFSASGYIIHRRANKESSALFSLFTKEYGKLSAIASNVFASKRKVRSDFSALHPLNFELIQKSGYALTKIKAANLAQGAPVQLSFYQRVAGLYFNELLFKLLEDSNPYELLYEEYHAFFFHPLPDDSLNEKVRAFEWKLLETLGYPVFFPATLRADEPYFFDPASGSVLPLASKAQDPLPLESESKIIPLTGEEALALKNRRFALKHIAKLAKQLFLYQLKWHTSIDTLHSLTLLTEWIRLIRKE